MNLRLLHVVLVFCAASVCVRWSQADVITHWNNLLLGAVRNESTSPPLAARNMAIVQLSVFDAVNALDQHYQPYHFNEIAPVGALPEAAAIGAAYQSLVNLYPNQRAAFDSALTTSLNSLPSGQARDDGFAFGRSAADSMLTLRSTDRSSTTVPYIPSTDPGAWRRSPPFFRPPELPQWPGVTPFAMSSGDQFRPAGPPALDSARYAADFNQVKELGALNSTMRTPEQTQIARFWSDFSNTVTPPGHWNQIAQNVAFSQNLSLTDSARMFALLNIGMADAGIVAWDAKYVFNSWRPVTAIQNADLDGNPATVAEPSWTSLLNTPPFPEYVSGHSAFSASAAAILAEVFGTDEITFTIGSDTLPGVYRTYQSFTGAADEIGLSRIYGGIHFLSADLDGLAAGHALGDFVFQNYLQPVPEPSTWALFALAGLIAGWRSRAKQRGKAQSSGFGIQNRFTRPSSKFVRRWNADFTRRAAGHGVLRAGFSAGRVKPRTANSEMLRIPG